MNRFLSVFRRKTRVPLPSEAQEKKGLEKIIGDMRVLEKSIAPFAAHPVHDSVRTRHPLYAIAAAIKPQIAQTEDVKKNLSVVREILQRELGEYSSKINNALPLEPVAEPSEAAGDDALAAQESQQQYETVCRLTLGQDYFQSLEELVGQSEAAQQHAQRRLTRLVDCLLVGTSSERVEEHMQLFGEKMNQELMQLCFYSLYEAEIDTASKLLQMYPLSLARHEKKLKKLKSGYLLDTLELNTKIRCVIAWADPTPRQGYQPVDDDTFLSTPMLIKGRHDFFPEGAAISSTYLKAVKGVVDQYYEKKKDRRDLMKKGAVFFVVTCIFDYIVCIL